MGEGTCQGADDPDSVGHIIYGHIVEDPDDLSIALDDRSETLPAQVAAELRRIAQRYIDLADQVEHNAGLGSHHGAARLAYCRELDAMSHGVMTFEPDSDSCDYDEDGEPIPGTEGHHYIARFRNRSDCYAIVDDRKGDVLEQITRDLPRTFRVAVNLAGIDARMSH